LPPAEGEEGVPELPDCPDRPGAPSEKFAEPPAREVPLPGPDPEVVPSPEEDTPAPPKTTALDLLVPGVVLPPDPVELVEPRNAHCPDPPPSLVRIPWRLGAPLDAIPMGRGVTPVFAGAAESAGVFVAAIHGCLLGCSSSSGKSRTQSASMNS
jgi:hypothetical protein